ncbi:hypothetical protein [Sphingomonas sp. LaA6.9]|uniref:hypothetical protein n=1 Tax=Sphingomonas sp. LaA6.9 TaxID=2919914 RepID=UPI001F4FB5BC|nr:hypothetical protein [Sphingomonas sp. LaA6.9]MCJ8155866.1 hypothetical protein [Sphingomonas sp. LaA6.9]
MKTKAYLLSASVVFVVAVTGSDLIARMTIAGESFTNAVAEHGRWASDVALGMLLLFFPFIGTALICASTNKRANTRSAAAIFCVSMATLAYFYFGGFQVAQYALLERKWTASALSVGLLPFFIGIPLLAVVAIAGLVAAKIDRRHTA